MTNNELAEIREKISCPQLGDEHYGEWGILTINQRRTIYLLLQEISLQKAEIERLTVLAKLGNMRANDYRAMRDKCKTARAETIQELLDRLEHKLANNADISAVGYQSVIADVNSVVKEMGG